MLEYPHFVFTKKKKKGQCSTKFEIYSSCEIKLLCIELELDLVAHYTTRM
jgi:hypothetical protein